MCSSGKRFLYNDGKGDGKPGTITISISLREPEASGGYETFAVNWQAPLDPLYDVSIGPFTFELIRKCDAVGKGEIIFTWYSPDQQYHKFKFGTRAGSRTMITPFAWAPQKSVGRINSSVSKRSFMMKTTPSQKCCGLASRPDAGFQ